MKLKFNPSRHGKVPVAEWRVEGAWVGVIDKREFGDGYIVSRQSYPPQLDDDGDTFWSRDWRLAEQIDDLLEVRCVLIHHGLLPKE